MDDDFDWLDAYFTADFPLDAYDLTGPVPQQCETDTSSDKVVTRNDCEGSVSVSLHLVDLESEDPVAASSAELDPGSASPVELSLPSTLPNDEGHRGRPPRFSVAAVQILRRWLSNHREHPYPSKVDLGQLQDETGLAKRQVTTWLANARQRGVMRSRRHNSTGVNHGAIDIPRRATPAPFGNMSPLQRWQNSPPEMEPASLSDIARSMTASLDVEPPIDNLNHHHNSQKNVKRLYHKSSSVSSSDTGNSSGSSFASSWSLSSQASSRSYVGKVSNARRRKRRTKIQSDLSFIRQLAQTVNVFQCTFCTETFRTKYDWERHEKSQHLSVEQWLCSPDGPIMATSGSEPCCVYCGHLKPDVSHLQSHNYSACLGRPREERTFHRKDHLRQHLKLVHGTKCSNMLLRSWKTESQDIRSRCGFCSVILSTWDTRASHIAQHFKAGMTMGSWRGDWGFEQEVGQRVENAIPPYLIDMERKSPYPFTTTRGSPDTPTSAYELLKAEIDYYASDYLSKNGMLPSDPELQYNACCAILDSELRSRGYNALHPSWLRDMLMSSSEILEKARLRPVGTWSKSRMTDLNINGKSTIFQDCSLEKQLLFYAKTHMTQGYGIDDQHLRQWACDIVDHMEALSSTPSELFSGWVRRLIASSTTCFHAFQQRVKSRASEPLESQVILPLQDLPGVDSADSSLISNSGLEGAPFGDGLPFDLPCVGGFMDIAYPATTMVPATTNSQQSTSPGVFAQDQRISKRPKTSAFFLHGNSSYERLSNELSRYVKCTMSLHNPTSHTPTDEELQHQARWIVYNDDDPWNQTPADNPEWLLQFKKSVGITGLAEDSIRCINVET